MKSQYIGVKRVEAEEEEKDGRMGYRVRYEDGYTSWSPKDVFDRTYFRLDDPSGCSLSENDITRFFDTVEPAKMGEKTTVTKAILINGFEMVDGSSCVDPKNYDEEIGMRICVGRMREKMWMLMGFVLQWAHKGIKPEPHTLDL